MIYASNPILKGFYPDPSICRVGENFYIVNSSFSYFPGVPIWKSNNLADWELIGNVLDRESQIPLKGAGHSQGIYAPTIRYHDGIYYMITTNIAGGGNFIVTANDPKGPWSEPHYLGEEAPGIDPSLFFDEDGRAYYVGTRPNPEGVRYNGDWEIWVQEIDLIAMKLIGKSKAVWKGALKDVIWPEGPHLYRKGEYYYLMIAEGGTGPNHAVTVARSKEVYGPYENNPNNPILTHRHLGKDYPIIYVGHADLVDDINGNWYIVMLASRRCEGYCGLGRETFLAKVTWEDDWPVVNPGIGMLEQTIGLPFEERGPSQKLVQSLHGLSEKSYDVVMLRNADRSFYQTEDDSVKIKYQPITLKELDSPSFLGFRQLSYHYEANLEIVVKEMSSSEETGLVVLQSNEYHTLLRVKKAHNGEALAIQVVKCINGRDQLLYEYVSDQLKASDCSRMKLRILGHDQQADFILILENSEIPLLVNVDIHEMSTEIAGGFVGNTIGVYATSNGQETESVVEIIDFTIYNK